MFITPAFAQTATAAQQDPVMSFLPILLILVVFFFFVIRPQNKRMQAHRDMVASLKKGDKVVTGGGLVGTVKKVEDDQIQIEIADGVTVTAVRATIVSKKD